MMQQLLKSFQRRLSDISGSNRNLLLLRLIANQTVDLHQFDFIEGKPSFNIIDQIIRQKSRIKLCKTVDSRDSDSNKLALRLRRLNRRVRFISEETGSFDLYVGWPFVRGKFSDGTLVRAPLLFFPVRLEQVENEWILELRKDVGISFNKNLLLAYAHYNQTRLPEEFVERTFDDFEKDSLVFRTTLYDCLKEAGFEVHFNQDLFKNELLAFKDYRKAEFEKKTDDGRLKLFSEAVLGVFPQAGSQLVPDYDYLLEKNSHDSLESFFADRSVQNEDEYVSHSSDYSYFLNKVKEEQTFTPFLMDAYQENAIKAVKRGNSLVVQGPPGTGKSQMICNLISDYVARGKRVLVVCQKRAALDVVYDRLSEVELTDFVALVHDFKNDRKEVYQKIANQIDRLGEYQRLNNNLDSIQIERDFQQSSRTIDQITEQLEEYRHALFDESECGVSVKELYLSSDPTANTISLTQEYQEINFLEKDQFEKKLLRFLQYAVQYNDPAHPWSDRVSFAGFELKDLTKIQTCLTEIPSYAKSLVDRLSKIVGEEVDYDTCRTLSENLSKLSDMTQLLSTDEIFDFFKTMVPHGNERTEALWLENTEKQIDNCFDEFGVELTIPHDEIDEIQGILRQRAASKNNLIRSIKWSFSKEKRRLARILVLNNLRDDKKGLKELSKRLDNRLNVHHQITKLREAEWIEVPPKDLDHESIKDWFVKMNLALKAKLLFSRFANFGEYFNLNKYTRNAFVDKINDIVLELKELPKRRKVWNQYVLPRQIDALLLSGDFLSQLRASIQTDFDAICEMDRIKTNLSYAEQAVVDKLVELDGMTVEELLALFDNSLRLAWINHIEHKYEILRTVSTLHFDQLVEDLQTAVQKKKEVSNAILLQKAREQTYTPVEYNRLNNRITYRELQHQVTKKRQVWPIRKLMSQFSDELFNLVPCWMASPESVSAMFPMQRLFDLVIFDEASQCFSEKGLPAVFRGNQVVVSGDQMQLRPNDLYKVKLDEENDGMEYEVTSLLELCSKSLMQIGLKGHYRSHSYDLIQFSNEHFYQGSLRLLPHRNRLNDKSPGISFMRVDGVWNEQSNEVEANRVADLVDQLRGEDQELSIGVITFNSSQQNLIVDTLEERGIDHQNMFVKNIENVQGDEKDVIIFSVGYGPDPSGKFILQFGSLNTSGGENRLNVAVTRARKKIYMITSIMPEQMDIDHLKNQGPKLLKAYLQYAKTVSEGDFEYTKAKFVTKSSSWFLKNKLKLWEKDFSLQLEEELPFADLTIKQDATYKGLVLTDDDLYYGAPSEKEVFVYKPQLMGIKEWRYRFFHSRNYWLDQTKVKDNLRRLLD